MHWVIDIPNLTPDFLFSMFGCIFAMLLYGWIMWVGGRIEGRNVQRRIESTACLYPFEHEGKKYWIRLYDSKEISHDGKGHDDVQNA